MPRTDATFGCSLLTSSLPQVMAPALVDIPTTEAATTNGRMSLVLTPIPPPGLAAPRWDRNTSNRPGSLHGSGCSAAWLSRSGQGGSPVVPSPGRPTGTWRSPPALGFRSGAQALIEVDAEVGEATARGAPELRLQRDLALRAHTDPGAGVGHAITGSFLLSVPRPVVGRRSECCTPPCAAESSPSAIRIPASPARHPRHAASAPGDSVGSGGRTRTCNTQLQRPPRPVHRVSTQCVLTYASALRPVQRVPANPGGTPELVSWVCT